MAVTTHRETNVPGRSTTETRQGSASPKEQTQQETAQAKREAGSTADEARRAASSLQETTREAASDIQGQVTEAASEASQQAMEAAERAKAEAGAFAARQKHAAAEEVAHVGAALHRAAEKLHSENDHNVAHYVDVAADRTNSVARYLQEKDYSSLLRDARVFVKKHPGSAFTGLFVAGVTLSRFLKASECEHEHEHARQGDRRSSHFSRHAETGAAGSSADVPARTQDVQPPGVTHVPTKTP